VLNAICTFGGIAGDAVDPSAAGGSAAGGDSNGEAVAGEVAGAIAVQGAGHGLVVGDAATMSDATPIFEWDLKRLTSTDTHHYFKKCQKQIGFLAHRCKTVDLPEVRYPDLSAEEATKKAAADRQSAGQSANAAAEPSPADSNKLERLPSASLVSEVPLMHWWYLASKCQESPVFCVDLFLSGAIGEGTDTTGLVDAALNSGATGGDNNMMTNGRDDFGWGDDGRKRHDRSGLQDRFFVENRDLQLGDEKLKERLLNTHNKPLEIYNRFQRVLHSTLIKCAGGLGVNLEAAALQTEDLLFQEECYEIQERYLLVAEAVLRVLQQVLIAFADHVRLPKYVSEDLLRILLLLAARLSG
ncbi:unnamed protein product, partial [Amoebophrya sp. A25]